MSEDIRVNDVVVCIDASEDDRATVYGDRSFLRVGGLYRVVAVTMTKPRVAGVRLLGDPNNIRVPNGAWAMDRFRKLPPADAEFTNRIRACEPAQPARKPILVPGDAA